MEAFSVAPSLSTTGTGAPSLGSGASGPSDTAPSGLSFGGIFNSLRPDAGRQDLAAVLFGSGLPVPTLVSQPLGEAMAVITPDSPVPEQDSLLAFARSQGLDETAIAALWQQPAANTSPATNTGSTPASTEALAGLLTSAAGPMTAATTLAGQAWPATATLPTGATPALTQASANGLPSVMVMGMTIQAIAGPTEKSNPANATAAAPSPELEHMALQPLRMAGLTTLNRSTPKAPPPPSETVATGANTPNRASQETPTLDLDLDTDLAELARLSESSADTASDTSTDTPTTSTGASPVLTPQAASASSASRPGQPATPLTPPHTVISGYQLKAEHYQQLADRMGQALAQRLQEQIESGQWSMKLRLNPVELGQIDVQLDMHQGGLDARFQTDNPLTKDLILQGSGRLKESLSQSGMTVATVWVNSDDRRQSGGNSTPQQQQRRPSSGQNTSRTESVAQAPAQVNSRPDGWDMLA